MGRPRNKASRGGTGTAAGRDGSAAVPSPRGAGVGMTARRQQQVKPLTTARSPISFSSQSKARYRQTILGCVALFFILKASLGSERLLPWGPAVEMETRAEYMEIDHSNDLLQFKHGRSRRIYERFESPDQTPLLKAPETVVFDSSHNMYLMTEEGNLLMLSDFRNDDDDDGHNNNYTTTAKTTFIRSLGNGRPLGGAFHGKSTLYIADAILGLTRIRNIHDPKSKVEVVVSSVNSTERLQYVDDVVVGPKSNKVYFTDASDIAPPRLGKTSWDTMYASKLDLMRGKATGSVYEYNPTTDQVKRLVTDLHFANGISIDSEERFLVVAETFGPSLRKYHLQGDQAGRLEVLVPGSNLTGYPDGVDCVGTTCYAILPSAIVPIHKLLLKLPDTIDVLLRTVLLMLPPALAPQVKQYAGAVKVDAVTGQSTLLQDPNGQDLSLLCGVTVHNHRLYFGSVHNNYVGVYELPER